MLDIASPANNGPVWSPMVDQIGVTGMSIVLLVCTTFLFVVGRTPNSPHFASKGKIKRRFSKIPGPRGLPIIGNVHQFGKDPHKTFVSFSQEYGDVFQIAIGSRPVIVLNGAKAIRQALISQPVDFAGRPELLTGAIMDKITGTGITFANYDEGWRLRRKIGETALRHFTMGKQIGALEERVLFEASELVTYWTNNNEGKHVINPETGIRMSVSNVLCSFLLNKRHDFDDQKLLKLFDLSKDFVDVANSGNAVNFMPWLNHVAPGLLKKFENYLHKFKGWFDCYFEEHAKNFQPGAERDILDYLMTTTKALKAEDLEAAGISKESILECIYDFFGAGTETVPVTIMWLILYMMKFPEIQRKVHEEIDCVIGNSKPSILHRGHLPYTEAVIAEALRHSSAVPLTMPHTTTRDTTLQGGYDYHIPKDTVIFVNLYSVHHDPKIWKDHEKFHPERFLKENGTLDAQLMSYLVPFGAGRRRCVGEGIAKAQLFLYFTYLMQKLKLEKLENENLSLDGVTSLSTKPLPYNVRISTRS